LAKARVLFLFQSFLSLIKSFMLVQQILKLLLNLSFLTREVLQLLAVLRDFAFLLPQLFLMTKKLLVQGLAVALMILRCQLKAFD